MGMDKFHSMIEEKKKKKETEDKQRITAEYINSLNREQICEDNKINKITRRKAETCVIRSSADTVR